MSNNGSKLNSNYVEDAFAYRAIERMYILYLKLTTKTTLPEIYELIDSKFDEMSLLYSSIRMEVINTFENECKNAKTICLKDDYECFKNMIYKIKGNKDSKIEPMNKEIDFIISEIFGNYENFKNDTKKYQKYVRNVI